MKLSASSRGYVAEQVRNGFAEELRAAERRLDDAKKAKDAPYEALMKDFEKVSARWMAEFGKLMEKHGLHWSAGRGPEEGAHARVFDRNGSCDYVDKQSFAESDDTTAVDEAKDVVKAVESQIEKAVQKALFEIEIHGRKDTLQEIVEQVIREIKEGK